MHTWANMTMCLTKAMLVALLACTKCWHILVHDVGMQTFANKHLTWIMAEDNGDIISFAGLWSNTKVLKFFFLVTYWSKF